MKHLSVDEIIEFVSSCRLDSNGIECIKSVNEHIRKCPECLKTVRAFQMVYDEFSALCLDEDFENYVNKKKTIQKEMNGYR